MCSIYENLLKMKILIMFHIMMNRKKNFWETHRITRNGIKKLTAFDEKEGDKVVVWNEYRRIEIFEKASTADSMMTDGNRVIFYKDSEEVLFFDPKECYYRSFKLE